MDRTEAGLAALVVLLVVGLVIHFRMLRYWIRSAITQKDSEPPPEMRGGGRGWIFAGALVLALSVATRLYRGKAWYAGLMPIVSDTGKLSTPENLWLLLGYALVVLGIVMRIREMRDGAGKGDTD